MKELVRQREETVVDIKWQEGTVPDVGVNGAQVDEVVQLCIDRLTVLRDELPDRETSLAITKLEEALMWLNERTQRRTRQGVEGTHLAHV